MFYFNHENHKSRWMRNCPFLFPLLDHSMPKYISIYMNSGRLEEVFFFFFFFGYQTKRLHHITKFGVSLAIILASFLLSANTESEVLKKTTSIEYCLIILYLSSNKVSIHKGQWVLDLKKSWISLLSVRITTLRRTKWAV